VHRLVELAAEVGLVARATFCRVFSGGNRRSRPIRSRSFSTRSAACCLPIASLPAPEGEGGAAGIGVPYQDYIPFFPMVQDPATGQWRDGESDEMLGPEGSEPNAPASPQMLSHLLDSTAPGTILDPELFDPNAPGPTLDPRLLLDSDSSGPTIDPALLDASAPRPTPWPTIDPALLDPHSPGPTSRSFGRSAFLRPAGKPRS
jgi:hypothetical protein